jgi:hypothetical protein
MRFVISFIILGVGLFFSSCHTAQNAAEDNVNFSEITFHTSPCFGSCPAISVHIDKNRNIEVTRQFYKGKMEPDTANSGNFKGEITESDYKQLLALIQKIDWETINFPKVMCCDGPVRTFILSYNNKTYRYKSMTPPESTNGLTDFLKQLASSRVLPRYDKPIQFEDIKGAEDEPQ